MARSKQHRHQKMIFFFFNLSKFSLKELQKSMFFTNYNSKILLHIQSFKKVTEGKKKKVDQWMINDCKVKQIESCSSFSVKTSVKIASWRAQKQLHRYTASAMSIVPISVEDLSISPRCVLLQALLWL